MAGCDGWITIKILELLFATFCMIYKRVTDDEANKLFYYLQKYSREWPLLNNITWEENGGIFADITYGSYIIIIIGLIIGQTSGEFIRYKKLENFFLVVGALLFIAAGSLELAALESVEEKLVDNAAILGVFSLVTGFLFIIDLLTASKRRKKRKMKFVEKKTQSKLTQTEKGENPIESIVSGDPNGNLQNGAPGERVAGHRIPKNAVKILPSSPVSSEYILTSGNHPGDEFQEKVDYFIEPPIVDESCLKTHEGRIRSTESFLRSEKGLYPKVGKKFNPDKPIHHYFIPNGFVLVPADHFQPQTARSDSGVEESYTPPGYSQINPNAKVAKSMKRDAGSYVMISADENRPREYQSPAAAATSISPKKTYYINGRETNIHSPQLRTRRDFRDDSSEASDNDDSRPDRQYKHDATSQVKSPKNRLKYHESDIKDPKYVLHSDESSDERKTESRSPEGYSRPGSRFSEKSKEWRYRGIINEGLVANDVDKGGISFSDRIRPHQSSATASSAGKPHGILRFESFQKEKGIYFPKDVQYDSLDGKKIAEDLRTLKEITRSDLDLTTSEFDYGCNLRDRSRGPNEEKNWKKVAEEKNRRISEKEEQYFGLKDLKQSHRERQFDSVSNEKNFDDSVVKEEGRQRGKNSKGIKLTEDDESKSMEEAQEFGDLIEERFNFLNEEDKKKGEHVEPYGKSNRHVTDLDDSHRSRKTPEGKRSEDSEESHFHIRSTNEEGRVQSPGNASYKSEALVWVENHGESRSPRTSTPVSPASPGYVLYTAQNWPESPSPQDRFQFNSKEAQRLSMRTPSTTKQADNESKRSNRSRFVDFEDASNLVKKSIANQKGLLVRKVDVPIKSYTEMERPSVTVGSTSTWKKWLQSKPKLVPTKSAPN